LSGRSGRERAGFLFRALRHRDYRLFFFGQLVSLVGTWMQSVAQAWLAYRLTGSAALLGALAFAGQFATFLLSPVGGLVADRAAKRRILLVTQAASMGITLVLAGLTLSGRISLGALIAGAVALGLVNGFDIPARQAFVVDLVGRRDLVNAIALNSSVFNGARVVGPAIAGLVVAAVGEGWCFLVNGLSYLAPLVALGLMRPPAAPRRARRGALADLADGLRFVVARRPVRALLLLLGIVSFTGMPYAVLMPVFASRILDGGARGLGVLMSCSGLGALGGALYLASRTGIAGLGRIVAGAAALLGAALVAFALSRHFALSAALLVPVGFAMILQMAASNTLLQSMVPDELRGRVMAAYAMMFLGMAPLGGLAAGLVAERIGAPATVAAGGLVCLAGAAAFASRLGALRSEARRMIVATEPSAGDPPPGVAAAGQAVATD
jgi:MFS family permease